MPDNVNTDLTPNEFINLYYDLTVEEGMKHYSKSYLSTPYVPVQENKTGNDAGHRMLELASRLNDKDKETIMMMMRVVILDTSSSLFGILDGTTYFRHEYDKFTLLHNGIDFSHGDLQELFLIRDHDGTLE